MTTEVPVPAAAMTEAIDVQEAEEEVVQEELCPPSPSGQTTNNYWGWKETVKGTLSSLNLSNLGNKDHVVSPAETSDTSSDSVPKMTTGGGYWEWKETIKKTLSNVSLGTMGHREVKKGDTVGGDATTDGEAAKQSQKNYWHWRNSFKSASDLAQQEKEGGSSDPSTTEAPGSYWFWRNPSLASLSQINLDQAGQEAEGDSAVASSTPTKSGGPLTNLEHKLRNSWRKSFQQLSSSSLSKLDEGKDESKFSTWKDSFQSFRKSVQNLNPKPQSDPVDQDVFDTSANDMLNQNSESSLTNDESQQSLGGISF